VVLAEDHPTEGIPLDLIDVLTFAEQQECAWFMFDLDYPALGNGYAATALGDQKHRKYYLPYFSKTDTRSPHRGMRIMAVVIVKGSCGNVAGRDGCPTAADVIESYNLPEGIMQG
jgi:hypothetical protein